MNIWGKTKTLRAPYYKPVVECFCSAKMYRSYIIKTAINPVPTGISILSKSPEGRTSRNVVVKETITAAFTDPETARVARNTEIRQALEPAKVLPPERGITLRPNNFPNRLAKPSPNASA